MLFFNYAFFQTNNFKTLQKLFHVLRRKEMSGMAVTIHIVPDFDTLTVFGIIDRLTTDSKPAAGIERPINLFDNHPGNRIIPVIIGRTSVKIGNITA